MSNRIPISGIILELTPVPPRIQICCDALKCLLFVLCAELLERWKSYSSMWNGAAIWILEDGKQREAVTCGLSPLGALRVRNEDGLEETLLAGDVSVRRA